MLRRRRTFSLHEKIHATTPFERIDHLKIGSIRALTNCSNYFPNVRKLSLTRCVKAMQNLSTQDLLGIIPRKQITTLSIIDTNIIFEQLLNILQFTPNVRTLKLCCLSLNVTDLTKITQQNDFQTIARENLIREVILKSLSFDSTRLFILLCPRLNYLIIDGQCISTSSAEPIL